MVFMGLLSTSVIYAFSKSTCSINRPCRKLKNTGIYSEVTCDGVNKLCWGAPCINVPSCESENWYYLTCSCFPCKFIKNYFRTPFIECPFQGCIWTDSGYKKGTVRRKFKATTATSTLGMQSFSAKLHIFKPFWNVKH